MSRSELPAAPTVADDWLESASHSIPDVTGKQLQTVVFPVIHGTNGEDGTLQGLLELSEVAYVGCDHVGSSIGIDKSVAKRLVQAAGVPVVPWVDARLEIWRSNSDDIVRAVEQNLTFPVFVKPARLGSSVGVVKVESVAELKAACEESFRFDDKLLIETGVDAREIECAALGGYDPEISLPGEVAPKKGFYSYEAKYEDAAAADLIVPADITDEQSAEARSIAKRAFTALELYGMARVDLFLDRKSGKFFFNEVNTVPGFTEISQYPMLWAKSGLTPGDLIDRLIRLALDRQAVRRGLQRSWQD